MSRFVKFAFILLLPVIVTACNTMEGLGEDIQKGGQKLEHEANENK